MPDISNGGGMYTDEAESDVAAERPMDMWENVRRLETLDVHFVETYTSTIRTSQRVSIHIQ